MARIQGYATITSDAALVERDTISCAHCNKVVFIKPGTASTTYLIQHTDGRWTEEAGAFCRPCMKPVCLACDRDGRCLPLERRLATLERTGVLLVP